AEMVVPLMTPWVKEPGELVGYRIDAGGVWPLVSVIVQAGQREIIEDGFPLVLDGNDMVEFKRDRVSTLGQVAVFAHTASPVNGVLPGCLVDETSALSFFERPPGFGVKESKHV